MRATLIFLKERKKRKKQTQPSAWKVINLRKKRSTARPIIAVVDFFKGCKSAVVAAANFQGKVKNPSDETGIFGKHA